MFRRPLPRRPRNAVKRTLALALAPLLFFACDSADPGIAEGVTISPVRAEFASAEAVSVRVENETRQTVQVQPPCVGTVEREDGGTWVRAVTYLCEGIPPASAVAPGEATTLDMAPLMRGVGSGTFRVVLPVREEQGGEFTDVTSSAFVVR